MGKGKFDFMEVAKMIAGSLSGFNPEIKESSSGSVYISFKESKVKQVRIANHSDNKSKRNVWEVRTDVMTRRSQFNHVYNIKDVLKLIFEFK